MNHRDLVLLLLFNAEGKFLLQHRSETATTYPGYWGFFGGGIEAGESVLEAFRREISEELRYSPSVSEPALAFNYRDEAVGRFGQKYYFMEIYQDQQALELHEGQAMGWFTLEEAATLRMNEANLATLRELVEKWSTQGPSSPGRLSSGS